MITSSILNPITFKLIGSSWANPWNTLHFNYLQAGLYVIPYCQPLKLNEKVVLQFCSDSATVPTIKIFDGAAQIGSTINGVLGATRSGDEGTRYYYNFEITFTSAHENKEIDLLLTQGTDILTSEPCEVLNFTTANDRNIYRRIEFSNFDRDDTDLSNYLIDWDCLPDEKLFFYVESVDSELNLKIKNEVLEGALYREIVSGKAETGIILKSGIVPHYIVEKLSAASILDYFSVNEVQYTVDGDLKSEKAGGSTSFQMALNLVRKELLGFNTDNINIENYEAMGIEYIKNELHVNKTGTFDIEVPEGYMLHTLISTHSATSSGNDAVLIAGTTVGGFDLIDNEGGIIEGDGKAYSFLPHTFSDRIYFSITGTSVLLDIHVQFLYKL